MEQWKSYLQKWGQGCNVETRQEMCKPDFLSCDKNFLENYSRNYADQINARQNEA